MRSHWYIFLFTASIILLPPPSEAGSSEAIYEKPRRLPPLLAAAMRMANRPGLKYVFGASAASLGEYDCSSFVQNAAREAGLAEIPRSSRAQFALMRASGRVWLSAPEKDPRLKPGDLIFFSGTFHHRHPCPISHVMVYAGQGLMIGAQPSGVGYFRFVPTPPKGSPGEDCSSIRRTETVYAYARPSWSASRKILLAHPGLFDNIK